MKTKVMKQAELFFSTIGEKTKIDRYRNSAVLPDGSKIPIRAKNCKRFESLATMLVTADKVTAKFSDDGDEKADTDLEERQRSKVSAIFFGDRTTEIIFEKAEQAQEPQEAQE